MCTISKMGGTYRKVCVCPQTQKEKESRKETQIFQEREHRTATTDMIFKTQKQL